MNGGPAFPSPGVVLPHSGQQGAYEGMTLRDYFAAKAMQGLFAALAQHGGTVEARACYLMADAMLKAREAP